MVNDYIIPFIYAIVFLGSPLFLPLILKKWTWLVTVGVGYGLYISWGILLHFTRDVTEYGTGYGIFILPYIIGISILGAYLQKKKDKNNYQA